MNNFFKPAGDLADDINEKKSENIMNEYFKPAGDLTEENSYYIKENNPNEINDYLLTIVSGQEFEYECELGTLCSEGSMIVSLEQLQEMIKEGNYNIIKAEYYNPEMISIEYQQYKENDKKMNF